MGVSERFACRVTGQNRTAQRHAPAAATPADPDAGLRSWLRRFAKDNPYLQVSYGNASSKWRELCGC